jgi:hypothetical protein
MVDRGQTKEHVLGRQLNGAAETPEAPRGLGQRDFEV